MLWLLVIRHHAVSILHDIFLFIYLYFFVKTNAKVWVICYQAIMARLMVRVLPGGKNSRMENWRRGDHSWLSLCILLISRYQILLYSILRFGISILSIAGLWMLHVQALYLMSTLIIWFWFWWDSLICSNILIKAVTIIAPVHIPNTDGINPSQFLLYLWH